MRYQGIVPLRPFPVNRHLTKQDDAYRLEQRHRMDELTPCAGLMVIRLNSSYLELVDKYFDWKGYLTAWTFVMCLFTFFAGGMFIFSSFQFFMEGRSDVYFGLVVGVVLFSMGAVAFVLGRHDWIHYTHFPIRFNRKTRMVHVFRKDGSVLSTSWDGLFFTLDSDANFWEPRGHVLDPDGITVRETFALGVSSINNKEGLRKIHAHWEFCRRYMEDGAEAVAPYVKQVLPIDGRRESFRVGYEVLMSHYRDTESVLGFVMYVIMWPVLALSSLARWVAMRTSKVPRWPAEIEAMNEVSTDDSYCIDARINPPGLR
ncbi:MAG: DUF6708 domain-containing protein [Stenotrophomonas sp.]|uniref:DUF6708 domain-containing protein n=1 Tax=Stenotrophomonas sp. TaxID=69392 RepID=UPI003D6D38DB